MDQLIRDTDPTETREWRDALGSVLAFEGAHERNSCSANWSMRRAVKARRSPTPPTRPI